jgi:hypothetical protein
MTAHVFHPVPGEATTPRRWGQYAKQHAELWRTPASCADRVGGCDDAYPRAVYCLHCGLPRTPGISQFRCEQKCLGARVGSGATALAHVVCQHWHFFVSSITIELARRGIARERIRRVEDVLVLQDRAGMCGQTGGKTQIPVALDTAADDIRIIGCEHIIAGGTELVAADR